jgi:hypothetical protein
MEKGPIEGKYGHDASPMHGKKMLTSGGRTVNKSFVEKMGTVLFFAFFQGGLSATNATAKNRTVPFAVEGTF